MKIVANLDGQEQKIELDANVIFSLKAEEVLRIKDKR